MRLYKLWLLFLIIIIIQFIYLFVILCLRADTFLKPEKGGAREAEALWRVAGRAQKSSPGEGDAATTA